MRTLLESAIQGKNLNEIIEILKEIKSADDFECVCVMHIIDEIVASGIDLELLKQRGIIVDLDQFEEIANRHLQNVAENSALRAQLKRLHRGLAQLLQTWKNDTLKNISAVEQCNQSAINDIIKAVADNGASSFPMIREKLIPEFESAVRDAMPNWINSYNLAMRKAMMLRIFYLKTNKKLVIEMLIEKWELLRRAHLTILSFDNSEYKSYNEALVSNAVNLLVDMLINEDDPFSSSKLGLKIIVATNKITKGRITNPREDYAKGCLVIINEWINTKQALPFGIKQDRFLQKIREQHSDNDEFKKIMESHNLDSSASCEYDIDQLLEIFTQVLFAQPIPIELNRAAELEVATDFVRYIGYDIPDDYAEFTEMFLADFCQVLLDNNTSHDLGREMAKYNPAWADNFEDIRRSIFVSLTTDLLCEWKRSKRKSDLDGELNELLLTNLKRLLQRIALCVFPNPALIAEVEETRAENKMLKEALAEFSIFVNTVASAVEETIHLTVSPNSQINFQSTTEIDIKL